MAPTDGVEQVRDREAAAAAVRRLADAHGGLLYAVALRACGDRADAEDVVQETLLQAFRSWHGFRGESSEKTWLFTIAGRMCGRRRRRRAGEPARIASLDAPLPFGDPRIAVIPSEQEDALQIRIRREARERVEAEIATLPEEFRVPLVLKEIVGLSGPEVAAILGLAEATVRTRVHRARLKLRAAVDRVLPRGASDAPPPAYPLRTCLDLLNAKQEALDRGVPFDEAVICDRCRSVFASLDLTQQACRDLADGAMPEGLRERIERRLVAGGDAPE